MARYIKESDKLGFLKRIKSFIGMSSSRLALDVNAKSIQGIKSHTNQYFALVAVRCNSETSTGKRRLLSGHIYQLLDGYSLSTSEFDTPANLQTQERCHLNSLYDEYLTQEDRKDEEQPHVIISAIVGKNGSGKSSLVEFIMRIINNFAAITFGEERHGSASARLHFIDGVDGDLWYVIGNNLYQLHVSGKKVILYIKKPKYPSPYHILIEKGDFDGRGYENIIDAIPKQELYRLYRDLFYSIVSNFSIYAYNTNDFFDEWDSPAKEQFIQTNRPDLSYSSSEERCWLHGLFHKNDGYQTPMVITPYRSSYAYVIRNAS